MILSHIVAVSRNFVIGKNNRLPWRMPNDLQYFHDVTMGHMVIMGRKNYLANRKALPGRENVVISRSPDFHPNDAIKLNSIESAIDHAKDSGNPEVFIVGGSEIYRQTLNLVQRIYITQIDAIIEGDRFYPEIEFDDYRIISEKKCYSDENHPYDYTFYVLENRF